MTCNSTTLNNICVKKTPACPGLYGSTDLLNRRKRSSQNDNPQETLAVDNDNPFEMIFHPSKKRNYHTFLHEAKREYQENFDRMDMHKSYESLFELLWYTQMPCFDTGDFNINAEHRNGMIKSCSWKGIRMPCSKLFKAAPTDRGMCCSFNVDAANKMFKSSKYQKMILKMQERDSSMALDRFETGTEMNETKEYFTPEAGVSKGLALMLDSHSNLVSKSSISDDFEGFISIVNDKKQFPTTSKKSVLIRPGHFNQVSIQVTKVSASPDIRKYEANKRNCYFDDERELTAYQDYSRSKCLLECRITKVLNNLNETQQNVCAPWFFPDIKMPLPVCNPWEAFDFQTRMKKISNVRCRKCLPDCDGLKIRTSVSAAPFRGCTDKNVGLSSPCLMEMNNNAPIQHPPKWGHAVLEEYRSRGTIPNYIMDAVETNKRSYFVEQGKITDGKELFSLTNDQKQGYDAYEKDIAIVTFFFESSDSFEFLKQSKTSVIEFISQIGGLLGLCMGFSFISVVELIYWLTFKLIRNLKF